MEQGTMDEDDLPAAIARRRKQLGLSMTAAAELAGVHRLTWRAWEKGTSAPEEHNHVKIERALRWQNGSVASKRRGGPVAIDRPTYKDDLQTVLTTSRDQLLQIAKFIEQVSGKTDAERFLARAFELRRNHAELEGDIKPPEPENRDAS